MKKLVALLTAMVFAMTLGVAFAADQPAPAGEMKAEQKAPAKKKKKKKAAKKKKSEEKAEQAPAAPAEPAK